MLRRQELYGKVKIETSGNTMMTKNTAGGLQTMMGMKAAQKNKPQLDGRRMLESLVKYSK